MSARASTSCAGGAVSRLPDYWPIIRRLDRLHPQGWTLRHLRTAVPGDLKDRAGCCIDALLARGWIAVSGSDPHPKRDHRLLRVAVERPIWPLSTAERLWNALRAERSFLASADWAALASTDTDICQPQTARRYLRCWADAGHLRVNGPANRPLYAVQPAAAGSPAPPSARPAGGRRTRRPVNLNGSLRRAD